MAWDIQRELVNGYFRKDTILDASTKTRLAEAKLNNSRARLASTWLKVAALIPIDTGKQICASYASAVLTGGEAVIALPPTGEKTYTAEEVGKMLGGISKNMIGRTANALGIKTPEYGQEVWDKARYSNKQVPSFRYNENGIAKLREALQKER